MRGLSFVYAILPLVGLAVAQLPPGTPKCAVPCFIRGAAASPCLTNTTCLCTDEHFVTSMETCVRSSCIIEDALLVKNASNTICGIEPHNAGTMYTEISSVMTGFALFLVILRVVYRRGITSLGLGPDDWTIMFVAASCIPCTILNSRLSTFGIGRDIWTLTPYQITQFGLTFWILTLLYFADMALLKLSILLFFLRIFPDHKFRRVIWFTIVGVGLFGLSFVLAALFQCWPFSYNWTRWNDRDNQGHCVNYSAIAWANAAVSIALDFWMLYLPMSQVRSLNLDLKRKIAIGAMFVVGTFVTVVSIIRLASLLQFSSSENVTYDYTGISTWSTVEISTGVICACMPSMRLILARFWPNLFASKAVASSGAPYYNRGGYDKRSGPNSTQKSYLSGKSNRVSGGSLKLFSGRAGAGGFMDTVSTYPGRLERINSEEDELQLRPMPPVHVAGASSASELDPERYHEEDSKVITVTTSVNVKF
ncbi:uncharacterized protein B0I36DRAFT_275940 [Microdochium trichocladiopsis]|uniref:CFEM domain-containing protein n=1 Tax=Microdochium trichocladiopsis TaxID=1682393 RepID=A0A9P8XXT5_9PEZI|nr:uncharacterized protein B0I36DRAFT_275940 [Microdochium trichocladiopsis]KAH7021377.1 hypothetical protein B0I36DRAFT_275940 [Microdochium trichocladiopsis]